jgi:hypothetical protein
VCSRKANRWQTGRNKEKGEKKRLAGAINQGQGRGGGVGTALSPGYSCVTYCGMAWDGVQLP